MTRDETPRDSLLSHEVAYIVNCIPWEREDLREYVRAALASPTPGATLDVEALAEALHPHGKGPVVDCCMGSTTRNVHGEDEGERIHRGYHHDDAVALATEYAAIRAARGQQ